jgi:phage-related protein
MKRISEILADIMELLTELVEAVKMFVLGILKIMWYMLFTTPKNILVGIWNKVKNIFSSLRKD